MHIRYIVTSRSNLPRRSLGISFDLVWTADDVDAVLYQGGRLWVVAKPSHGPGASEIPEEGGRPRKWAYRCNEGCDEAVSAAWRAFCIPVATAFSRYWDEKRAAAGRREGAGTSSGDGYSSISLSAGRLYRSRVTQACSVLTAVLARVGAPLTAEMMPPTASPSVESTGAAPPVRVSGPQQDAAAQGVDGESTGAAPPVVSGPQQEDAAAQGVDGEGEGEGAAQARTQTAQDGKEEEEEGPDEASQAVDDSALGCEAIEAHKKRSHRARKRTIREARHRDAGRLAMLVSLAATVDTSHLVAAMKELQVGGQIDEESIQLASAALSGELQASAPGVAYGAQGVGGGEGSSLAKLLTSVAQSSKPSYRLGTPSAVSSRLSSAPSSGRRGGDSRSHWGGTHGTMGPMGGMGMMGMGAGEYPPQGRGGPGRFTDDQRSTSDYRARQTPPAASYYPHQQGGSRSSAGGGQGGFAVGGGMGSMGSMADSWEARSTASGGLHGAPRPYTMMASGSPQHMQQQHMHAVMGHSPTHYVSGPVLLQHAAPTGMHPHAALQPVHHATSPMMVQAAGGGVSYIQGAYGGSAGVPVSLGPALGMGMGMGGYAQGGYPATIAMPTMTAYAIPMQNMGMGMGMGGPVMLSQPMQCMMPVGAPMRMGIAGEQGAQGSMPQATLMHMTADGQLNPQNM